MKSCFKILKLLNLNAGIIYALLNNERKSKIMKEK